METKANSVAKNQSATFNSRGYRNNGNTRI